MNSTAAAKPTDALHFALIAALDGHAAAKSYASNAADAAYHTAAIKALSHAMHLNATGYAPVVAAA